MKLRADIWRPWSRKWLTKQTWDDAVCIERCMLLARRGRGGEEREGERRERGRGERGGEERGGEVRRKRIGVAFRLIRIGLSSAAHERLMSG